MNPAVRRIVTFIEETHTEMGQPVSPPTRRAVAAAVIANPLAGRYEPDLTALMELGEELGAELSRRALGLLGIGGEAVHSFGKAAAVGEDGELEHAAALMHPRLGAPVRALIGHAPALIPSSKKRCGPGAPFDVPLGHVVAARVRSHFDGIEVRIPDAPRAGEIVLAVALTDSGRPLPRVGGLARDAVVGRDGLT
ncbi:MAG: amino acid synthesis family protein [Rubellimicrobium sp.]|nr:amino acid synthesis family protein [Rubellimicrobium sp.]